MNEWKQRSFSNHHSRVGLGTRLSRVPRWRAFNFAQVMFRCMLGMPSNSVIKNKKTCMQKVMIFEKKICLPAGFEPASRLWFSMECCSSFPHFFIFNLLQNAIWSRIDSRWQTWSRRMMGFLMLGSWYVDVGSPRWVIGATDRQTDGFSALYI